MATVRRVSAAQRQDPNKDTPRADENTNAPLQQTQAAVPPAQAAAAANANAQAGVAQPRRDAAGAAQAAAQARIAPLVQARDPAQEAVDAINAQLAEIDGRED